MNNQKAYTSTLSSSIMKELENYARELDLPKNKIIEKALESYFFKMKRLEFENSFARANKDDDLKEMAEWGLKDYVQQLNDLDK